MGWGGGGGQGDGQADDGSESGRGVELEFSTDGGGAFEHAGEAKRGRRGDDRWIESDAVVGDLEGEKVVGYLAVGLDA